MIKHIIPASKYIFICMEDALAFDFYFSNIKCILCVTIVYKLHAKHMDLSNEIKFHH